MIRNGFPKASTNAWIFVLQPPTDWPKHSLAGSLFFGLLRVDEHGLRLSRSSASLNPALARLQKRFARHWPLPTAEIGDRRSSRARSVRASRAKVLHCGLSRVRH